MKKLLRGIYYFCAGIKSGCHDLAEWYTTNRSIPRIMRNRASLLIIVLAIIAGGWGLIGSISGNNIERGQLPSTSDSEPAEAAASDTSADAAETSKPVRPPVDEPSEEKPETGVVQTLAKVESEAPQAEQLAVSSASSKEQEPEIDAMASATRFTPISDEQLTKTLADRVKAYYAAAKASGTVFTPPAAGDIAAWKKVNPDTIGWISIPNTNINYPVLKGSYTDYYTYRGYYKESSRNGVIWVDSDTKLASNGAITSQNTVIYGHNWTNCWRPVRIGNPNDIMFAQLHAYDDAAFAKANPYINLATPDGNHVYQVFTVFYARPTEFAYNYADGERVPGIINKAKSMSIHNFGVPVSTSDKIITLSTCTRVMGQGDNQRFVVMAKKIS